MVVATDRLLAKIAHALSASGARHLVAAECLEHGGVAARTVPDDCLTHGFFDAVSLSQFLVLVHFFARFGLVAFPIALATGHFFAGGVQACKLAFLLY